jgi:hypothetical protein
MWYGFFTAVGVPFQHCFWRINSNEPAATAALQPSTIPGRPSRLGCRQIQRQLLFGNIFCWGNMGKEI